MSCKAFVYFVFLFLVLVIIMFIIFLVVLQAQAQPGHRYPELLQSQAAHIHANP